MDGCVFILVNGWRSMGGGWMEQFKDGNDWMY